LKKTRKRRWQSRAPDHFTQNQFGYSVGGPVLPKFRDKLFFFSNTEWNRVRSAGSQTYVVPTAAFLATTAPNTQAYFAQNGKIAPGVTLGASIPVQDDAGNTINAFQSATISAPINAGAGNPIKLMVQLRPYRLSSVGKD